jgi:autotransporter-associated beta strand protein
LKVKIVIRIVLLILINSLSANLFAVNSIWNGNTSTNLLVNTNWSGNKVPDNNATFNGTGVNKTPTLTSGTLTVHQFIFPNANPFSYTFTLSNTSSLVFNGGANGDGVHNNGGLAQTFNLLNSSFIMFQDRSSADGGTQPGHITYNLNGSSTSLNFNQAHNLSFSSLITGTGNVNFSGSAIQTFTSANTYTGSTNINAGTLSLSNSGSIRSSSAILVDGVLDVTNSMIDQTIKNLSGSGSIILGNVNLSIDQSSNTTYRGVLSGNSSLNKLGSGFLTITGDFNNFTGTANVDNGVFWLKNRIGGNVDINGGYFVGNATVGGNVNLLQGTIGPGNGLGTMAIDGNFTQSQNTTFVSHVDNNGNCSLLDVASSATIADQTTLKIIDYGGNPRFYTDYVLIDAANLSGQFSTVLVQPVLYAPKMTYTSNQVILSFEPDFSNAGQNMNQKNVAKQLDKIVNPSPEERVLLDMFYSLSNERIDSGLEELPGEQYSNLMCSTELLSKKAINSVY